MKLVEKVVSGGHISFRDLQTERVYRRMVGGLAWPCPPAPGFLVVVGEEAGTDEARRLWVLAEREAASILDLHRFCRELRFSCQAERWVGDATFIPEVRQFTHLDRQFDNRVFLRPAPFSENAKVSSYAQQISELTLATQKRLNFMEGGKISGYLLGRVAEESEKPAANFPPLAALGYAVAEILLREPVTPGRQSEVITTWDPYSSLPH